MPVSLSIRTGDALKRVAVVTVSAGVPFAGFDPGRRPILRGLDPEIGPAVSQRQHPVGRRGGPPRVPAGSRHLQTPRPKISGGRSGPPSSPSHGPSDGHTVRAALYALASRGTDGVDHQLLLLRAHAADRGWSSAEEFIDLGGAGAKDRRPALGRLMRAVQAGHIHAVLVQRLDRPARSLTHLVSGLDTFRALNVQFVALEEEIDTSTPRGQAMFDMVGALARLQRASVAGRTRAGLERARATGIRLGRPAVTIDQDELHTLQAQGASVRALARHFRCSRTTIRRRLRAGDPGTPRRPTPV